MSVLAISAETTTRFSLQNISDARGYAIAITGMLIVFVALTLISLFLTLLPKLLEILSKVFPEPTPQATVAPVKKVSVGNEELVAAIGAALHRFHGGR